MSVHVVSWVLRNSPEKLGRRLVLLSLADHAREDGTDAWPSIATLMQDSRLSERQVRYCLRGLEEAGAIIRTGRRRSETQRHGTYVYSVIIDSKGAKSAPFGDSKGAIYDTQRGQPTAPELSLEPSLVREPKGSLTAATQNGHRQDLIWDALDSIFGKVTNDSERSRRSKAVKLYRQSLSASSIPEPDAELAIRARRDRYLEMWDHLAAPSDIALASRWDQCKPTRTIRSLPERRFTT